jgi:hypothetical protein
VIAARAVSGGVASVLPRACRGNGQLPPAARPHARVHEPEEPSGTCRQALVIYALAQRAKVAPVPEAEVRGP